MKKMLLPILILLLAISSLSYSQITSAGVKGLWGANTTWIGGVVPTATDDVVIAAGDSVTFSTATAACKNLTINGVLLFSKTVIVALTVNGNITISSTGQFKTQTNANSPALGDLAHTIDLKGNFTNNGSAMDFRNGSAGSTLGVCNITLSGSTNSTITLTTPFSTTNGEFNGVTINKSGGAKVILGSNWYISGGSTTGPAVGQSNLVFVNGLVETGNFTLVHLSTTTATVSGYSNASYVVGAMGRGISSSSASSKIFPVGDLKELRPFTLYSTTSGSATGHHGIVRCISGNANTGSSTFAGGIDKVSAVRYYQIGYNTVVGTTSGTPATSMGFNNFKPSYGADDGVVVNSNNVRVAYSTDRAIWTGLAQTLPDTVKFLTPAKQISTPDVLATAITLNAGQSALYVALARVAGTTDNPLTGGGTLVETEEGIPTAYALLQNYPNPFNPTTSISFSIPKSSLVTIKVYDILGKEIALLLNEQKDAGNYKVSFDASKLSSGVYFYSIHANGFTATKKMVLMK